MADNKSGTGLPQDLRAGRDAVTLGELERRLVVFQIVQPLQREGTRPIRLDKERIVIGSVVSADVRLTGDGVEPIHAVIEILPDGKAIVYDLASQTGVFVNGTKVITGPVQNGDELTVGTFRVKFSTEERASSVLGVPGASGVAGAAGVSGAPSAVNVPTSSPSRGRRLNPDEDFKPLLLEDSAHVEQIFDYRPANRTALEVVMAWRGTILDISHFVTQSRVVVGTDRDADFGIPPLLASHDHPLVIRNGEEYVLNVDPAMKGVLQSRGSLRTMDEVRASSNRGTNGHPVVIGKDDFAKVSVGEIDFFLSFTQAPPRLKRRRLFERDPLFLKIFSTSILLTVVTIYGLSQLRVVQSLEAEQIPERLATILYQPEKFAPKPKVRVEPPTPTPPQAKVEPKPVAPPKPQPKPTVKVVVQPKANQAPKPVPKEMNAGPTNQTAKNPAPAQRPKPSKGQTAAKEGEGARAKGTEGSRGTKHAAVSKTPQNKAAMPSPNGGKGPGGGNSQGNPDIGNVDFLKGATGKIENILGNAGAQLGKSGDSLKGLGGFDTRGNGGQALSGHGQGGGGSSDLAAGLGNKGRGFGRVGTGMGAAGNGHGILGGEARVSIRTGGDAETVVMGSIDADAIDAAIRAHQDEFRLCYEREINAEHPNIGGRVGTTFVIGPAGRVGEAGIESSSLKNPNVERCIIKVIKRIDFPIPRGGGVVQVSYPFKFSPVGR